MQPVRLFSSFAAATAFAAFIATPAHAEPRVVLISLDGATPRLVREFMHDGTLPRHKGLGLLAGHGASADFNMTVHPSLTAPSHIAIATGSTAARNDIPANTFHLTASPFNSNISGFGAPIGGYAHDGPAESHAPTAEPLWLALRAAGRRVATATFPGGDGVNVRAPGLPATSPIIQSADKRTVDYTVPFGAFDGPNSSLGAPAGARGFVLNTANFAAAPAATVAQLTAAGKTFFGTVMQTTAPTETITAFSGPAGGKAIFVAALDTTNDGVVNYDTLVFFDGAAGIQPGPFAPPSTGPAYVKASEKRSGKFFIEGSGNKSGVAFYVSLLAPDLSSVHFSRTSANFIPRNAAVIGDVDDINNNVGFWAPQPDFRIPEKLSPGYGPFSDLELEDIYLDLVRTFVDYQTRVGLRAIEREPNADLVMIYIEQPDGSGHQFTMTDPRQASNPLDASTIGANQDPAKRARYRNYLRIAYQTANEAVQRIIDAVGTDRHGEPKSNVFVVSDHGMAPFHTAVNLSAFLASKGFDPTKVRAVTSGPAANIYISLQGREPNGVVTQAEYVTLQEQLVKALREFRDTNPNYVSRGRGEPVFDQVFTRPLPEGPGDPPFGLGTNRFIGQDSGDVYAVLSLGYNFDGTQLPAVQRLGDDAAALAAGLSVPNFYGAHGYDPRLVEMSAIFFAAGPDVCKRHFDIVRNIDIAPTILDILGVLPAATVQGRSLHLCSDGRHRDHDRDDDKPRHEDRND